MKTGEPTGDDPEGYDAARELAAPATSREAPENPGQVQRIPNRQVVYYVKGEAGPREMVVLPIQGKGLWSTLYGFLALDKDGRTIRGITFYQHGETPGLGGEVDNPRWKALWKGKQAFDDQGEPIIEVIKGHAEGPEADHQIDGISGATITGRGVSNFVQFWLGENGYRPFLEKFRQQRS
jgi:Na+-transporting NADH:ubiquinone oxidoreductase subunit C